MAEPIGLRTRSDAKMAVSSAHVEAPYIVTQLYGGVGNQLFQYAAGKAVAERSKGLIFVDVGAALKQGNTRPLGLFHFAVDAQILCTDRLLGEPSELAAQSIGRPNLQIVEEVRGDAPDNRTEALSGDVYLIGFWQHYEYFKHVEEQIRKEFTLYRGASPRLRQAQDRIRSLGSTVGVHIRRRDYLYGHGGLPISYYHDAFSRLKDLTGTAVPIFFSDDPQWVSEKLVPLYGGEVVSKSWNLLDHEELFLMSSCNHHIIANSSFSWWGAWLGKTHQQYVIRPHPWFAFDRHFCSENGICPQNWLRVDLREPFLIHPRPSKLCNFPRGATSALVRPLKVGIRNALHRRRAKQSRRNIGCNRPTYGIARNSDSNQDVGSERIAGRFWVETANYRRRITVNARSADSCITGNCDIGLSLSQMHRLGLGSGDYDRAVLRTYPVV
jgi:hypothetical protein